MKNAGALSLLIQIPALLALTLRSTEADTAATGRPRLETVLSEGMELTAKTPVGSITILAKRHLQRTFIWNHCERTVTLEPRQKRWLGSLGAYFPGGGTTWRLCDGIDRAIVDEGEQHFQTDREALSWIHEQTNLAFVYTDDGLMLGWERDLSRKTLNVALWQILVAGAKPSRLAGSNNSSIAMASFRLEPEDPTVLLIAAVERNDRAEVERLLKSGVTPNATTNNDMTALMVAVGAGSVEIARTLITSGGGVNDKDLDGMTPLLYATIADNVEEIKLLLAAGADPNGAASDGMTALMWASMGGKAPAAELLLGHSAKPNVQDANGRTALMLAAGNGWTAVIRILLERGASVRIKDKRGATALQYADGYPEIVSLLRKSK
jgi:ankyrin repeat protein